MVVYIMNLRRQGNTEYTWRFFLPGNPKASTLGAVPMIQLALFSFGDQFNGALSAPASPFVSQTMQSVMTNAVLIWMLAIAFLWIGTRYKQVHYIGCLLVIVSMVVGISTQLSTTCDPNDKEHLDKCLNAYKNNEGNYVLLGGGQMMLWYAMFLVSTVPMAFGNIYKQKVLQQRDVDVWYATWWSGNWQVVWGWVFCWVNWLPIPGASTPSELPNQLSNTLTC